MDPINSLSKLMEALRQRMSEAPARLNRQARGARSQPATPKRKTEKPPIDEIQRRVAERIKALNEESERDNKAVDVFLESVLAWEFGDELREDPGFHELVREVRDSMTQDPQINAKLKALVRELSALP